MTRSFQPPKLAVDPDEVVWSARRGVQYCAWTPLAAPNNGDKRLGLSSGPRRAVATGKWLCGRPRARWFRVQTGGSVSATSSRVHESFSLHFLIPLHTPKFFCFFV